MKNKEVYICYDMGDGTTMIQSKENWLKWFDIFGDKENFSDSISWFEECVKMQLLVKVEEE